MSAESVISLAERLKRRREELGITQAQAARELDVARTAYRLWELEAARPAPDRWRLISRWLGVSVTTMLLAEELLTEEEALSSEMAEHDFSHSGKDWDTSARAKPGDFFAQAEAVLQDGVDTGDITHDQAADIRDVFERIASQSSRRTTGRSQVAELRKQFPADRFAPKYARDAVALVTIGLANERVAVAQLLVSELVTNSVIHGPKVDGSVVNVFVDLYIGLKRDRLRVEVADGSPTGARPKPMTQEGGYGLAFVGALADRWGAGREDATNVTWFELDLPLPGQ
jgi:transcriptional regulator with XRE-family HTH domain/anti-sigma regulatory factor (Ser/Thr protein kinase)